MSVNGNQFPAPTCAHTDMRMLSRYWDGVSKRRFFADCGKMGGCDVIPDESSERGVKLVFQRQHYERKQQSLNADQPSLPLFLPNDAEWEEPCMEKLTAIRKHRRLFLWKTLRQRRGNLKLDGEQLHDCRNLLEDLQKTDDVAIPRTLETLMGECQDWFGKDVHVELVNTDYSGGCIRCVANRNLPGSKDGLVLYPTEQQLNHLNICPISHSKRRRKMSMLTKKKCRVSLPDKIYQVESSIDDDHVQCITRRAKSCDWIKIKHDVTEDRLSAHVLDTQVLDSKPTSVCLSPYIPEEAALAVETGEVFLWSPDNRLTKVSAHEPRFTSKSKWWSCQFGAHPRLLSVADQTGLALQDIRIANGQAGDLFTLPHPFLHSMERVTVAKQHSSQHFYHFIGTHFNLVMVDERFPNHPVLHWCHSLLSPPLYMDLVSRAYTESDDDILLMASQESCETHCFEFNVKHPHIPAQSTMSPWRISRIDDFSYLTSKLGLGVDSAVVRRRLQIPLTGVCAMTNPVSKGFTAFQMTSRGDLFYQTYKPGSPTADKTCSAGPGSQDIRLTPDTQDWCATWLREAQKKNAETEKRYPPPVKMVVYAQAEHAKLTAHPYPHMSCSLCMPGNSHVAREDDSQEIGQCLACGKNSTLAKEIKEKVQQDKLMPEEDDWSLPGLEEEITSESTDPMTQILSKLWKNDLDIREHLVKKEEERAARRQARQTKTDDAAVDDMMSVITGSGTISTHVTEDTSHASGGRRDSISSRRRQLESGSSVLGFGTTPKRLMRSRSVTPQSPSVQKSAPSAPSISSRSTSLLGGATNMFQLLRPSPAAVPLLPSNSKTTTTPVPSKKKTKYVMGF